MGGGFSSSSGCATISCPFLEVSDDKEAIVVGVA